MPGPMFQIGESLREARTRRGLTPADVHKAIRIRERYLTALEEERWAVLPGEAYVRGFLKTYADFLGLDGNLYLDEYSSRIGPYAEEPLLSSPLRPERRVPVRAVGAVGAVVVVIAAVAGLLASRLGGSSAPRHAATPPSTHVQTPTTVGRRAATHTTPARPAVAVLTATRGRCWLLVRSGGPSGTVPWEGMLEQGQVKTFRLRPRVWVRMGAPSMLDLRVAGRLVPGLPSSPENLLLSGTGATRA
jgi:cytoskeleton protein RodZ